MELRALQILANAHSVLGDMFVLGEEIPRGERLARELNNPQAWIEFVIARANDAQLAGQFLKADKQYAETLTMAQKSQLLLDLASSYAVLVNAALDRGLKTNVAIYATKAYDLFESQGDLRGMALMLAALGIHSSERFGGEEFLLIVLTPLKTKYSDIFERLRGIVFEMPINGMPVAYRPSFSMGECRSLHRHWHG